jgi:hypothetical protein
LVIPKFVGVERESLIAAQLVAAEELDLVEGFEEDPESELVATSSDSISPADVVLVQAPKEHRNATDAVNFHILTFFI